MKSTLRFLVLGLLMLIHSSLFGQQDNRKQLTPEAKAKRQTAEMKTRLNLNDDQTSKVYDILLSREKEMTEKRDQVKQRNQAYQGKIQSVLSEDQQKEFKKMQEEKRDKAKARKQPQSAPQKDPVAPKNP